MTPGGSEIRGAKPRVLWLHPQPEYYFNLLIDALNEVSELEYVAGYMTAGPGVYEENVPRKSRHVFLRVKKGMEGRNAAAGLRSIHEDWRGDVEKLKISCGIVSGYAGPTQRGFIHELHGRGVPVLMMSDSNIRTQRGRGVGRRVKRCVKKRFLRSIIRDTDCLLTMNSRGVAYWRYFGAPRKKIVVCPFYADYAAVEKGRGTERGEVLRGFGLPVERKMILTAARLIPLKRIGTMIRFFRELHLGAKGWMYVLAGTGPLEGELKAAAGEELGRSIFMLGFVQPVRLMPLMCHADLFALTSDYEAHGIVIGESCAAGTPVFASDVCGASHDLVFEGVSGWKYRNFDLGEWKRKLELATADAGKLAAMRAGTRGMFEEWFKRTNPVVVVDREVHRLLEERSQKPEARSQKPEGGRGMNKKRLVFWSKAVVLAAVMGFVVMGKGGIVDSCKHVALKQMAVDWRWGFLAVGGFCGSMLTSGLVWRWLAGRMNEFTNSRVDELTNGRKGDGLSTVRLVGAYTVSQLGKYIPGKVALLLIRIERAGRFGMGMGVCTLSTLLENALYIISGGLVSMMAVVRVLEELRSQGVISERQQRWQWPVIVAAIVGLAVACTPAVFYGVVNRVLRKMKKSEVPTERRLGMGTLALAVLGFVPCWVCGGVALWASTRCLHEVEWTGCWWFTGAFALSVVLGMVSLLPGGIGVRELVLGVAATLQLSPMVGHDRAVLLGGMAAVLQRLFQVAAEVVMGVGGMVVTGGAFRTEARRHGA